MEVASPFRGGRGARAAGGAEENDCAQLRASSRAGSKNGGKKVEAKKVAADDELLALTSQLADMKVQSQELESLLLESTEKLALKEKEAAKMQEQLRQKQAKTFAPELDLEGLAAPHKDAHDERKPKPPVSVYLRWCSVKRPQVAAENPAITPTEVTKVLGEMWKKVTSEEKAPFQAEYNHELGLYAPLKKAYDDILAEERVKGKAVEKLHLEKRKEIGLQLLEQYETYHKELKFKAQKGQAKDPEKPKAALSAYLTFASGYRAMLAIEQPKLGLIEASKLVGAKWQSLSSQERAPYEEMALEDKARYVQEMEAYTAKKAQDKVEQAAKYEEDVKVALELVANQEKQKMKLRAMKQLAEKRQGVIRRLKDEAKKNTHDAPPKRPPSGYLLFAKETRSILKANSPFLTPVELTHSISAAWKALTALEKQRWINMAAPALANYTMDMARFRLQYPLNESTSDTVSAASSALRDVANIADVAMT